MRFPKPSRYSSQRKRRRGFSFAEIIVAVLIIGILSALVIPRLLGRVGQARQTAAMQGTQQIIQAIDMYLMDIGRTAPPSDFSLDVLTLRPDEGGGPQGPYIYEENLIDPWGNPYVFRMPGTGRRDFDVISYGADGRAGGTGDDADIINGRVVDQGSN